MCGEEQVMHQTWKHSFAASHKRIEVRTQEQWCAHMSQSKGNKEAHWLYAVAQLVAVLIAGIGQRLIKADVLAGTLAKFVHLALALWGRQLISVVLFQP